jgi:electron transport complex protein RnfG
MSENKSENTETETENNIENDATGGSFSAPESEPGILPAPESEPGVLQAPPAGEAEVMPKPAFDFGKFKDSIAGTAVILGGIALITALMLALVNHLTAPVIREKTEANKNAAVARFFGEGSAVETLDPAELGVSAPVTEILAVRDALTGELSGYCIMVEPVGFNGVITMLVAVNPNGTVLDTDILSESETGRGPRIRGEVFRDQFKGKRAGITLGSGGSGGNSIDAEAGATVSSRAFMDGVNAALDAVAKIRAQ